MGVQVFKFGGTSVAEAERIRRVVELVRDEAGRRVVVVSALGGVTDRLLEATQAALERTGKHPALLEALRERHEAALQTLVLPDEQDAVREVLAQRWQELSELLDGVFLLRECTQRTRAAIIGTGERLSAPLVAAAFRTEGIAATALDATRLIRTDATFSEAVVDFAVTNRQVKAQFEAFFEETEEAHVAVVTGFIAATDQGVMTTLGRSGSDYTATILGAALHADRVVIWTDVDRKSVV